MWKFCPGSLLASQRILCTDPPTQRRDGFGEGSVEAIRAWRGSRVRCSSLPRRRTEAVDSTDRMEQKSGGFSCFGEVAKWLGNGLQNRYTRVRIPSSPPDVGG